MFLSNINCNLLERKCVCGFKNESNARTFSISFHRKLAFFPHTSYCVIKVKNSRKTVLHLEPVKINSFKHLTSFSSWSKSNSLTLGRMSMVLKY